MHDENSVGPCDTEPKALVDDYPAEKPYHGSLPPPASEGEPSSAALGIEPGEYRYARKPREGEHARANQNTTAVGTGLRADAGKLRYDLLPVGPLAEEARVYTLGAAKYGDNNWRGGIAYENCVAALMRHVEQWRAGESRDADGQHHMASVKFWANAIIQFEMDEQEGRPGSETAAVRDFLFSPVAV